MPDKKNSIKSRTLMALLKRGLENKSFTPSPERISSWKAKCLPIRQQVTPTPFDLVLIAAEDDLHVVAKYLDFYKKNISPTKIIIITKTSEKTTRLFSDSCVQIIDENTLLPGLTYSAISKLNTAKTGWYFQQFLKMAYATKCAQDHYLIFDGDTVPLVPFSFFNGNKGIFIKKGEFFAPYFKMIELLFDGEVKREVDFSFIAESMLINKHIMLELMARIENNEQLSGTTFYEKILSSLHSSGIEGREFSEYETYGNYIMRYHKETYEVKQIRSLREAMKFFSDLPAEYVLDYLSRDFDTISFERKHIQEKPLGLTEYINKCISGA